MIRLSIARVTALIGSATLAFLSISPIAVSPAQAKNLTFPDSCSMVDNGNGNFTMTCGATPPGALSCFISGAPSGSVAAGTVVNLTMSCSGGTSPYRYSWNPGGATTGTLSTTVGATTTFSVTATDAANQTSTQSVVVTVGGGGGGGGGSGLCANYSNVPPFIDVAWGQANSWYPSQMGTFGDNTVLVFRLVVPAGTPSSVQNGTFTLSEFQGPETLRQMTISTQACDFRTKDYTGANGPLSVSNGTRVTIDYGVGTPFIFGPAELTAGQTYYVSLRNWQLDPTPQSSCGQTSCGVKMHTEPPH